MEGIEPGSTKLTNVEKGRSKTETRDRGWGIIVRPLPATTF
jgi:hypothetical protein